MCHSMCHLAAYLVMLGAAQDLHSHCTSKTLLKVAGFIIIFSTNSSSVTWLYSSSQIGVLTLGLLFSLRSLWGGLFSTTPSVAAKLISMLLFFVFNSSVRSFWNNPLFNITLSSVLFLLVSFKNFWYCTQNEIINNYSEQTTITFIVINNFSSIQNKGKWQQILHSVLSHTGLIVWIWSFS